MQAVMKQPSSSLVAAVVSADSFQYRQMVSGQAVVLHLFWCVLWVIKVSVL
jgi:hypothetical protein